LGCVAMAFSYPGLRSVAYFTASAVGFLYYGRHVVGVVDERKKRRSEILARHAHHEVERDA